MIGMKNIDCSNYKYDIPLELQLNYNFEWLDNVNTKWNDSCNFAGLLENMRLFIQGEITDTPVQRGRLQDYDPEYISRLLLLNSRGVLTTNGQEFKQTITKDKIYMQREYINFAYKPLTMQTLAHVLTRFNNANLFYYAITFNDKKVYQSPDLGRIGFDNPEIWVSRTLNRRQNMFENHTHIVDPSDLLLSDMEFSYYASDFYEGTVFFQVWNRDWQEKEHFLLDIVIDCLS
jgi:hypothetical protein